MKLGRRGVGELVDWVWPMVLMIIAVVVILMLVRSYEARTIDPAPLEMESYAARIINDPTILVYADPVTGRAYPGVIDATKCTADKLDNVFTQRTKSGVSILSARINISETLGCNVPARVMYNDETTFNERLPIAKRALTGPGGATTRTVTIPITVVDGTARCPATMTITMVRVNA